MAGLLSAPPSAKSPSSADETAAVSEHQAPAEHVEGQTRNGEDDEVLREDVDGVLGSAESRLHQREAEVHEEHQRRGQQHPDGVERDGQLLGGFGVSVDAAAKQIAKNRAEAVLLTLAEVHGCTPGEVAPRTPRSRVTRPNRTCLERIEAGV